jgi:hypothetical protein
MRPLKTDPNLLPALGSPTATLPVLIRRSKERSEGAHRVHAPRLAVSFRGELSSQERGAGLRELVKVGNHPVRAEFGDRHVAIAEVDRDDGQAGGAGGLDVGA